MKLLRLEKEVSLFQFKKKELGEKLGKIILEMTVNQALSTRHHKNRDNSVSMKENIYQNPIFRNNNTDLTL